VERDPGETERALAAHRGVQNELARLVLSRELKPLEPGPGDPLFDIAWWDSDTLYVAEVKSVTDLNETRQLRLGLGQILDYQDSLSDSAKRVEAILALERRPTEERWLGLCEQHGVRVFWSGHMPL
jgi:hypothetical protein